MSISIPRSGPLAHFAKCCPRRFYATDNLADGVWLHQKWLGLRRQYVQPVGAMIWCLTFDCDHGAALFAATDGLLPPPNLCTLNPDNGRGHLIYFLAAPVPKTDAARLKPLRYVARIERGMTCRLDADPAFAGLITKNPLNPFWRTFELHSHRFQLGELDMALHDANCIAPPKTEATGFGRNCTVFDEVRQIAYRKILEFKRNAEPRSEFGRWTLAYSGEINAQFPVPLPQSEVRSIARSIRDWVWERFDEEGFSALQAARGRAGAAKRWANHVSAASTKPWEALGISRASFYRRMKREAQH